jgi:flagellin-like hook-associated protein FlgL
MPINTRNAATMQMVRGFNQTQTRFGEISNRISSGNAKQTTAGIILGESLRTKASIYETINRGISYTMNMLNVASSAVSGISDLAEKALALSVEASGKSQEQIAALDTSFKDLIKQINDNVTRAKFDGKELLSGDLGGSGSSITRRFSQGVGVTLKAQPAPDAHSLADGPNSTTTTLTVAGVVVGDTLAVAGTTFTFVDTKPKNSREVQVGSNNNQSAANLLSALVNSDNPALGKYEYEIANNVITVSKGNSVRDFDTDFVSPAHIAVAPDVGALAVADRAPIDFSGIKDVKSLLGKGSQKQMHFAVGGIASDVVTGTDLAVGLQQADGSAFNIDHANDRLAKISCKIGDKTFYGGLYAANGTANLNGYQMRMRDLHSDDYFMVNFAAGFIGFGANGAVVACDGAAVANITTMLNQYVHRDDFILAQNQYLVLDTAKSQEIQIGDEVVCNTQHMAASLSSDDFTNLKFEKFEIVADTADQTRSVFKATISGKKYESAPISNANLVHGYKLELTYTDANPLLGQNKLSIYLGKGGIKVGSDEKKRAVAEAFSKAFGLGKALEIRTGESLDDKSSISIESLAPSRLFADNAGVSHPNISIASDADRKKAEEVLANVQKTVSRVKTYLNSQIDSLSRTSDAVLNSMTVQAAAASTYLDTNYQEATQELSDTLSRNFAIVAALLKQSKIEENVRQLLMQG